MAFLDFIKNRNASSQPFSANRTQARELENARGLLNRDVVPQKAQASSAEQIPGAEKDVVGDIRERIERAQPTNAQQQTLESAKEQAKPDRILERLERAPGSRLSPTPNLETDGIDPQRLARAERFVDASARPKREEPPPMRWPRQRGSWER